MVSVRHSDVKSLLESSLERSPPKHMMYCLENVPCGVWNAAEEGQRSACSSVHCLILVLVSFHTIIQQLVLLASQVFFFCLTEWVAFTPQECSAL